MQKLLADFKRGVRDIPLLGPALCHGYQSVRGRIERRRAAERYPDWIASRVAARANLYPSPVANAPRLDLFTLTYNTPPDILRRTAASVFSQDYFDWQWVILDNGSSKAATLSFLGQLNVHPRVSFHRCEQNLGITAGHAHGLNFCTGDYVVFLDHDDLLDPDALRIVAWHIVAENQPGFVYTDEDKCESDERRFYPSFKPDVSPALLLDTPYTCHLSAARRDLLLRSGAFSDASVEGTQDWDMTLRMHETGERFVHAPEIVYTWRGTPDSAAVRGVSAKPYVIEAQRNCLSSALARRGLAEKFEVRSNTLFPAPDGHWRAVRTPSASGPAVDLILPALETPQELAQTVADVVRRTSYPNYRLRVVGTTGEASGPVLQDWCREHLFDIAPHIRFETGPAGALNYSNLMNQALAGESAAEYAAFLPPGVRFTDADWLWEAIGCFELNPRAAVVGGRLFDANHWVIGGPAVFGLGGAASVVYAGRSRAEPGSAWLNFCHRNVLAVVGAPWVIERAAAQELGGFDTRFARAWFEADFGARCRGAGREVVYSPFIAAYGTAPAMPHDLAAAELAALYETHVELLRNDPFYSPYLSLNPATPYEIAAPGERAAYLNPRLQHVRACAADTLRFREVQSDAYESWQHSPTGGEKAA